MATAFSWFPVPTEVQSISPNDWQPVAAPAADDYRKRQPALGGEEWRDRPAVESVPQYPALAFLTDGR